MARNKKHKTDALATQLAGLTVESLTNAITKPVRGHLGRVRIAQGPALAELLLQIGRDCAAHLQEPFRSVDHGDFLYGKKGLPRTGITSSL